MILHPSIASPNDLDDDFSAADWWRKAEGMHCHHTGVSMGCPNDPAQLDACFVSPILIVQII